MLMDIYIYILKKKKNQTETVKAKLIPMGKEVGSFRGVAGECNI
jgi:hypothetical protein